MAKTHQGLLLKQIGEKSDMSRRKLQEQMEEEKAAKLREIEYNKRIKDEQEKGKQMVSLRLQLKNIKSLLQLLDIRKKRPY